MDGSRLRELIELLEAIDLDRRILDSLPTEDSSRLLRAIDRANNPDNRTRRRQLKAMAREAREARVKRDDDALNETGIRALRRKPVFTTPNYFRDEQHNDQLPTTSSGEERVGSWQLEVGSSSELRHCYVCKQKFTEVHHFYDQMCPPCAELNYRKRTERADLHGRVALMTGARVKIGYQAGLKLLRCGARLIVTTRFPRDAAARYANEPDFGSWKDRLEIFGLDLRHSPSVEAFCHELLTTRARLDFIVNNACQTVRRPPAFYRHMIEREMAADKAGKAGRAGGDVSLVKTYAPNSPHSPYQPLDSARLSQVALLPEDLPGEVTLFPAGQLDQDLQQIDLRDRNSWRLLLHEVSTVELLEVQLVNAVAPFIINARLKPLMLRTAGRDKHIVNVSAMEGQFYRNFKTTRHPHTNMAKAALNMLTRTSAADYEADGIHMNSVDTGWVTDEDPVEIAARKTAEQRFHPPLDIVDGAARILDPIISGLNTGTHVWGQFLKDYQPTDW